MKYSVKYKKVYDKDNHIVDISTVTKENKEPEYYSIGTHTPMVAALGEKNQHYFKAKKGYALNPETELHEDTKKMLKYRFRRAIAILSLPYVRRYAIPVPRPARPAAAIAPSLPNPNPLIHEYASWPSAPSFM